MLDYVKMVKGGVITRDGMEDLTRYSSCMDQEKVFIITETIIIIE